MAAGETVRILLKYRAKPGGEFPRPVITASLRFPAATPIPLAGPRGIADSAAGRGSIAPLVALPQAPFAVTRIERQPDGGISLTFNAEPGRTYRVQYSDDASDWKTCADPILAGTSSEKWVDHGPPRTGSSPASSRSRFYRILRIDP